MCIAPCSAVYIVYATFKSIDYEQVFWMWPEPMFVSAVVGLVSSLLMLGMTCGSLENIVEGVTTKELEMMKRDQLLARHINYK
jgi:hypothetical protein